MVLIQYFWIKISDTSGNTNQIWCFLIPILISSYVIYFRLEQNRIYHTKLILEEITEMEFPLSVNVNEYPEDILRNGL